MKNQTLSTFAVLFLLALYFLIAPAQYVNANDIVVDRHCSLEKAIGSANNDSSKARCETGYRDDTIILEDNLELLDELPVITSKIILEGNGHTIYVRSRYPAFSIQWGDLTIKNLRVKFSGGNRSGPTIEIENGSLTIIDSQILRCTGKFKVQDSLGVVQGDSEICNYSAETVNSWFAGEPPQPAPQTEPVAPSTCAAFIEAGFTITARYGLGSGVQCQRVDAASIGNQSIVAAGYIDAIDVWGYIEQGVELCFPQLGSVIFLDAATAPRMQAPVEHFARGGRTCAALNRPGAVILVPGGAPAQEPAAVAPAPAPASETSASSAPQPGHCQVTTIGNLKLRSTPSIDDNVIGYVPRGESFSRIDSSAYWHKIEYQGQVGWISANARYVQTSGACG